MKWTPICRQLLLPTDLLLLLVLAASLTVSSVRAANIVQHPCSDSSHVTVPYKLSFYYYFISASKVEHTACITPGSEVAASAAVASAV